jgi:hypothetical protein
MPAALWHCQLPSSKKISSPVNNHHQRTKAHYSRKLIWCLFTSISARRTIVDTTKFGEPFKIDQMTTSVPNVEEQANAFFHLLSHWQGHWGYKKVQWNHALSAVKNLLTNVLNHGWRKIDPDHGCWTEDVDTKFAYKQDRRQGKNFTINKVN